MDNGIKLFWYLDFIDYIWVMQWLYFFVNIYNLLETTFFPTLLFKLMIKNLTCQIKNVEEVIYFLIFF